MHAVGERSIAVRKPAGSIGRGRGRGRRGRGRGPASRSAVVGRGRAAFGRRHTLASRNASADVRRAARSSVGAVSSAMIGVSKRRKYRGASLAVKSIGCLRTATARDRASAPAARARRPRLARGDAAAAARPGDALLWADTAWSIFARLSIAGCPSPASALQVGDRERRHGVEPGHVEAAVLVR